MADDNVPCDVIFECSDVYLGQHYRRCMFSAGHDGGHMVGEYVGVPYRGQRAIHAESQREQG